MEVFELIRDDLIKSWRRTKYEVEANSLEEAINMVKEDEGDIIDSEILYDTEELVNPEDNNGNSTVEIYDKTITTLLYHN